MIPSVKIKVDDGRISFVPIINFVLDLIEKEQTENLRQAFLYAIENHLEYECSQLMSILRSSYPAKALINNEWNSLLLVTETRIKEEGLSLQMLVGLYENYEG